MRPDRAEPKPGFRAAVNDARESDIWKPTLAKQSVDRRRLAHNPNALQWGSRRLARPVHLRIDDLGPGGTRDLSVNERVSRAALLLDGLPFRD